MPIGEVIASAFFGSLLASGAVGYATQQWMEARERRNKRHDLQLQLYLDVHQLTIENLRERSERDARQEFGAIASMELQLRRLDVAGRLELLGSAEVQVAYNAYAGLAVQEAGEPRERPMDPHAIDRARLALVAAMKADIEKMD